MADALCSPNKRNFWKEVRSITGNRQSSVHTMDNSTGTNEISKLFAIKYIKTCTILCHIMLMICRFEQDMVADSVTGCIYNFRVTATVYCVHVY